MNTGVIPCTVTEEQMLIHLHFLKENKLDETYGVKHSMMMMIRQ